MNFPYEKGLILIPLFFVGTLFKYKLLLHFIILLWGFTGILGKLIHLDAFVVVWYRVVFAFFALGAGMLFLKSPFKLKTKKSFLIIFVVGVFVGLHWMFFFKSIQLSTASLGILCLSTTPLHVSWLEPLVMGKKFSWIEFFLGVVVVFGVFFVSSGLRGAELLALIYGLCSAVFAAVFAVFNVWLSNKNTPAQISFYEMFSAVVFLSFVLFFEGRLDPSLFSLSCFDFFWLLFLGVVCTSFAFLAIIFVMKKLGTFTVALSINLEPVYTIFLAILILNENSTLESSFYIGAGIIVFSVALNAFLKHR